MLVISLTAAVLLPLLASATAHAQTVPPSSFRIEWARTSEAFRPAVEGYVYNGSEYRVGSVRLRVEVLDGSNRVLTERFAWVYGNIDAGGRAYFVLPSLESNTTYRITVESFFVISRQTP